MDKLPFVGSQWLRVVDPTEVMRQNANVGGEVFSKHQQVRIHTLEMLQNKKIFIFPSSLMYFFFIEVQIFFFFFKWWLQ